MTSSFKRFSKIFAIIISFCLIFNILIEPLTYAATFSKTQPTTQKKKLTAEIGEIPDKLPKTRLELTSKRTRFSTRYLNPNGSFTEEIYSEPQFYFDKAEKKWQKIDNVLRSSIKEYSKLENSANDFRAAFANMAGRDNLLTLEKDGKRLTMTPLDITSSQGSITRNEVTYAKVYPGTDLRYRVQGGGVKEDIILQNYTGRNTFTFEVTLNGLKAETKNDGTITFSDFNGINFWQFTKPYLFDANRKYSDKVKMVLRDQGNRAYVDVIVDQEFLQDPKTQYPVTIDPTINSWDVMRDTFISSANPNSSYSSYNYMDTGYESYFGSMRSLLQFYLPTLPSDSRISSANINAYQTSQNGTSVSVDLYRATSSWTTVTWNTQPTIGTTAESTVTSSLYNTYWQWDTTQLVKDWYNGVISNYGVMLKQQNEGSTP